MSFWSKMLGIEQPPPPAIEVGGEASQRDRTQAECHRDRFARAIVQCEDAVKRGEKPSSRLAELQQWHAYYDGLAQLEAGMPKATAEHEEGEA
jgi:hypothetical protein